MVYIIMPAREMNMHYIFITDVRVMVIGVVENDFSTVLKQVAVNTFECSFVYH